MKKTQLTQDDHNLEEEHRADGVENIVRNSRSSSGEQRHLCILIDGEDSRADEVTVKLYFNSNFF